MTPTEYIQQQRLRPTYQAAEVYAMLCVHDITLLELVQLIDSVLSDAPRYTPGEIRWVSGKAEQVAAVLCAKDPVLERLRMRAKK